MAASTPLHDCIDSFVNDIFNDISGDVDYLLKRQAEMLGCDIALLKKPLPLDRASRGPTGASFTLLQQLLAPDNTTNVDELVRQISENAPTDSQDACIHACVGASGIGKTRLAYDVGMTYMYVCMIRVAEQNESGGMPRLTLPWCRLLFYLRGYVEPRMRGRNDAEREMLAKDAFNIMHLMILSYVAVTVTVLRMALTKGGGDVARAREVCLRFHRNGRAEELVERKFIELFESGKEDGQLAYAARSTALFESGNEDGQKVYAARSAEPKALKTVSSTFLKTLTDDIKRELAEMPAPSTNTPGLPRLMLCLDEVGTLLPHATNLFIRRATHQSIHTSVASKIPSTVDDFRPTVVDDAAQRGLFYAVSCLMCHLRVDHEWVAYYTTSEHQIDSFITTPGCLSAVKGSIKRFPLQTFFDTEQMITQLCSYFVIDDHVLQSQAVLQCFKQLEGRPHFFYDCAFYGVVGILLAGKWLGKPVTCITASSLCAALDDGIDMLRLTLRVRIKNIRCSFTDASRSYLLRDILGALIKAVYFQQGALNTTRKELLEELQRLGLLSAVSSDPLIASFSREPLVMSALQTYFDDMLQTHGCGALLDYVLPYDSTGRVAELAVVYYIVLKVRSMRLQRHTPFLLDVLDGLCGSNLRTRYPDLADYICTVDIPVNMVDWDASVCALRRFYQTHDSRLDTSLLLYNVPERMGPDLIFVVAKAVAAGDHVRVVTMRLKTGIHDTINTALLPLSPGTCSLTEEQRIAARDSKSTVFTSIQNNCGAGYRDFVDFLRFAEAHPEMCCKWIRIPAFARPVASAAVDFAASAHPPPTTRRFALFRGKDEWTVENAAALAESPVILAQLNSPLWLDPSLSKRFVTESAREEVSLVKTPKLWVPVSIERTKNMWRMTMR